MRKISVNGYPPFPNGGKMFQTWDGEFFHSAFYLVDPKNGESWWQNLSGSEVKNVTHWGELPYEEIDDKIVLENKSRFKDLSLSDLHAIDFFVQDPIRRLSPTGPTSIHFQKILKEVRIEVFYRIDNIWPLYGKG